MHLFPLFAEARRSPEGLLTLNGRLSDWIPFNRPHQVRIQELTETSVAVLLPYVESNFNHVQGLHACGLATAAEFASGILLLSHLDPDRYRLLLKSITVDFRYLGRRDALATFTLPAARLRDEIMPPLEAGEGISVPTEVAVRDVADHLLCTAQVEWHLKRRSGDS